MTDQAGTSVLGVWQGEGIRGDIPAALAEVERVAHLAAGRGVDLLVFPECFLTGYVSADPAKVAALVDRAVLDRLAALASEHGTVIVLGSYEIDGGVLHNSALVLHPAHGLLAPYRKQMLYGDWEKRTFHPGSQPMVFDWRGLKVGVLICYDVEFPERARESAMMGADAIVVPTALMAPYHQVPRILVPARAMENGVYLAYANRIRHEDGLTYLGDSCIIAPDGTDLARAGADEAVLLVAQISNAGCLKERAVVDYLADLHPGSPARAG